MSVIAAIRCGSVTRSTTCSIPSSVTRTQRLARLGEKLGEAFGEREAPDRRQVCGRGPGEVEAIGGSFRSRPLVRQDPAGFRINHLEPAEHSGDVTPYAG